nr:unnamed protein product [Digitaria exilis]
MWNADRTADSFTHLSTTKLAIANQNRTGLIEITTLSDMDDGKCPYIARHLSKQYCSSVRAACVFMSISVAGRRWAVLRLVGHRDGTAAAACVTTLSFVRKGRGDRCLAAHEGGQLVKEGNEGPFTLQAHSLALSRDGASHGYVLSEHGDQDQPSSEVRTNNNAPHDWPSFF